LGGDVFFANAVFLLMKQIGPEGFHVVSGSNKRRMRATFKKALGRCTNNFFKEGQSNEPRGSFTKSARSKLREKTSVGDVEGANFSKNTVLRRKLVPQQSAS